MIKFAVYDIEALKEFQPRVFFYCCLFFVGAGEIAFARVGVFWARLFWIRIGLGSMARFFLSFSRAVSQPLAMEL